MGLLWGCHCLEFAAVLSLQRPYIASGISGAAAAAAGWAVLAGTCAWQQTAGRPAGRQAGKQSSGTMHTVKRK
jgi:hypothetical protein